MRQPLQIAWSHLLLPLLCGLLILAVDHWLPEVTRPLHRANYDLLLRHWRRGPHVDQRLVFFKIDDSTTQRFGEIPLRRSTHAQLLRALYATRTQRVVFDLLFNHVTADDAELHAAMKQMPTLLALGLRLKGDALEPSPRDLVTQGVIRQFIVGRSAIADDHLPQLQLMVSPNPILLQAAHAAGHVTGIADADGLFRRIPLLARTGNALLPSLALATAMDMLDVPADDVTFDHNGIVDIGLRTLQTPIRIPTDECGMMLVNYAADSLKHFDTRSYAAQLQSIEEFPEEMAKSLAGKTVCVGQSLTGGGDFVRTPIHTMLPGTLVILNAVNTILTREFITVTPDWCVSLLALVLPFMLGGLYLFRKPALSILYASLIVGVLLAASPALFYIRACFLPVTVPLLACIVSALVLATHAHVREHTRATRMAALLARVASPALVQEIERQGTRPHAPKTRREELSVLFVDVAAYTPFTDHAEPEDLSGFLVAFYEATMEELPRHQGTLHQFLGDGILAYFGAPAPLLDKERLAVEAAMALQNRFAQICNARRGRGEKLLQIRCGIATGYVSIGFFGSERHAAYSVVGSAVNLAARLQSLGEPGQIILDERTAARLRNVVKLESLGHLKLKGFDQPASVYRVATVKQI